MLTNRTMLVVISGWIAGSALLAGWLVVASPAEQSESDSKSTVKLPKPPARIADAAVQAETCIECHDEMADLFQGDKHVADDFHCVVCHGESKGHVELEEEDTPPDRTWRRWIEEENRFEWRMKNASLEIATFCASCHGRKPAGGEKIKTIDWDDYLDTGHGLGVRDGNHDAPTCTDCHYAHGAGCEPLTDQRIVQRCALCHADQEMMERAGLDPGVIDDFKADKHEDMAKTPPEEKSSCIKCHYPH